MVHSHLRAAGDGVFAVFIGANCEREAVTANVSVSARNVCRGESAGTRVVLDGRRAGREIIPNGGTARWLTAIAGCTINAAHGSSGAGGSDASHGESPVTLCILLAVVWSFCGRSLCKYA